MKNNNTILLIVVAVLIGVGGFFAGMKYQQSTRSSFARQFGNGTQGRNGGPGRGGFRPVSGEIIKADDTSITVKLTDGSSKIILLSEKTEINKADQAQKSDLKIGERVAVFGTENTDGSVTANSVQLNPIVRGMIGGEGTKK